jgi:hypothetical protein
MLEDEKRTVTRSHRFIRKCCAENRGGRRVLVDNKNEGRILGDNAGYVPHLRGMRSFTYIVFHFRNDIFTLLTYSPASILAK